ncbi:MAG: ABC transporter permease [Ruminococcus sp.]|nr:ABC transporter permease [Ruminococcus sp.]MDE7226668.1 ABC transporter permease [Ruminococcus sp.]
MKFRKLICSAVAGVNIISVAVWVILTAYGNSIAESQSYNYSADRWDDSGGSAQISCFFTEDSGFNTDISGGVRADILSQLKNISIVPEEGKELIPEAYSTPAGKMTVRCDTTGRSEAEVTAVGGDFFLFRGFTLLDGSYFNSDDIMQDGAVIDRNLAWSLYGSYDVAGMNIYINGTKFYIAGVIDNPQTKEEKQTAGEFPKAYVSYDGINLIQGTESAQESGRIKKITVYECIAPNPVENFAYNAVSEYLKSYEGKVSVISNSERFKPSVRAKTFRKLSDYAVADKPVVYPYWENASRIAEFKLSGIYFYRRLTYVIPVLTVLWLLFLLYRLIEKTRRKLTDKTADAVTRVIYNHNQKKYKEQ